MIKITMWALIMLSVSVLVSQAAETTTSDNLLSNSDFEDGTVNWILSDENVKIAGPYSDAGNSQIIRFKGQTSTITQSVDLSSLESGKQIIGLTIKLDGYGCGNSPGGWCNDGSDDTITTNITFNNGSTEISNNVFTVPYEDGFTAYSSTQSITNDTFLTGATTISFSLQGIDAGDSSSWLGPISDNYQLLITYQDYNQSIIGGLNLDTAVTNEIILDQPIPMNEVALIDISIPDIDINMNIDAPVDVAQDVLVDIPVTIETRIVSVDILPVVDIAPVEEIQEIKEIPQMENLIEPEIEVAELDEPEELKTEDTQEQDIKEKPDDTESEVSATSEQKDQEKDEEDDESKLSKSTKGESNEEENDSKENDSKENSKESGGTETKPKSKDIKIAKKSVDKIQKPIANVESLQQVMMPIAYLQVLTDSITIVETISLIQGNIYDQDITTFTSNDAWDSLNSSSQSRWDSMVGVKPRYSYTSY